MASKGTILVTGGSRGIGAACARVCAREGFDVAVNYRTAAAAAQQVVAEIRSLGRQAIALQADVGSETDVVAMFAAVNEALPRLAGLVNNAGILFTKTRLEEMDAARVNETLRVNVTGSVLCAREAIVRMSKARGGKGGAIVNISSGAARIGSPNEFIDYAASKGAIDTMTLGLSKEVAADGIRVNAVRPGLVETDIHAASGQPDRVEKLVPSVPMGRSGQPEEVAETVVWLLSDAASFVNGALVDVTGGR